MERSCMATSLRLSYFSPSRFIYILVSILVVRLVECFPQHSNCVRPYNCRYNVPCMRCSFSSPEIDWTAPSSFPLPFTRSLNARSLRPSSSTSLRPRATFSGSEMIFPRNATQSLHPSSSPKEMRITYWLEKGPIPFRNE